MNTAHLQQNKKLLLAQCELDRRQLNACLLELEAKTGWAQLGATAAMVALPKLKLAMPVLTFLLPYILPSGGRAGSGTASGIFSTLGKGVKLAVQIGQKTALVSKGIRYLSARSPKA